MSVAIRLIIREPSPVDGKESWISVQYHCNNSGNHSSLVKSEIAVQRRDQLAEGSLLFA